MKPSLKWFHLKGAESVVCLCLSPWTWTGLRPYQSETAPLPSSWFWEAPSPSWFRLRGALHRRPGSEWGWRHNGVQLVGEETWTRVSQSCWCWEARSVCVLVLDLPFWLFLQFNHQETCCSVTLCYKTQICSHMKFAFYLSCRRQQRVTVTHSDCFSLKV